MEFNRLGIQVPEACLIPAILLLFAEACLCIEVPSPIQVLAMGGQTPSSSPLSRWSRIEPNMVVSLLPATINPAGDIFYPGSIAARRYVRVYFPRTYDALRRFGFLMYEHIWGDFYTIGMINQMERAISDGVGAWVGYGGGVTIRGSDPNLAWIYSRMADIFPAEVSEAIFMELRKYSVKRGNLVVNKEQHLAPVLTPFVPLGIETYEMYNIFMVARSEATLWAHVNDNYIDPPFLISWRYGKAVTWACSVSTLVPWWRLEKVELDGNPYALDIFMNILYYSTGRELPEDVLLVHRARRSFSLYEDEKISLQALAEFLDKLGANIRPLVNLINEADDTKHGAILLYMAHGFEESMVEMVAAMDKLDLAGEKSIQIRRQALFWIYVVEWCSVTGASLLGASLIYSLMIRRRMYKEVAVTRGRDVKHDYP